MSLAKNIIVGTVLTGILGLAALGAAQTGDSKLVWKPMKPLYAISFDVGRKHVLSYFLTKNGICDLTLMVTDLPEEFSKGDELPSLSTARFKAEIDGGKTARIDTAEGKALEYACAPGAQTMMVRKVYQVAMVPRGRRNSE